MQPSEFTRIHRNYQDTHARMESFSPINTRLITVKRILEPCLKDIHLYLKAQLLQENPTSERARRMLTWQLRHVRDLSDILTSTAAFWADVPIWNGIINGLRLVMALPLRGEKYYDYRSRVKIACQNQALPFFPHKPQFDGSLGGGSYGDVFLTNSQPKLAQKIFTRDAIDFSSIAQNGFFRELEMGELNERGYPVRRSRPAIRGFGYTQYGRAQCPYLLFDYIPPYLPHFKTSKDIWLYLLATARSLAKVHHEHIVHRDINRRNFMKLPGSGKIPRYTLIDFGLSLREFETETLPKEVFELRDFPEYISKTAADDVTQFGIMIIDLLVEKSNCETVRRFLVTPDAIEFSFIPEGLKPLVTKMLDVDPLKRPKNGTVLYRALLKAFKEEEKTDVSSSKNSSRMVPKRSSLRR